MGHEIEKLALHRGHQIHLIVERNSAIPSSELRSADVAIEFTQPDSAIDNIYKCFEAGVPVVTGTTGWYDRFDEVKNRCIETKSSLFYASNFSLGVNLFWSINKFAAELLDKYEDFDPEITEIHHTNKKDAPSGTALTTADVIINNLKRKKAWKLVEGATFEAMEPHILPINSIREGNVAGIHTVSYKSKTDHISITHEAFGREGFAKGAVMASEWLPGKSGIFTMNNLLGF